ncbi:hypothetical protein N7541_010262 [Penicillium brevicompactum]|uniref:Mid2 domain-containing protein n=1 Tax=Penicillium brevicompactum TaxID=5074 RepID=A0A9W9QU95_PENBR|nr:hypothetical protein N7541_010262 [Penicillium brevicompactum]
MAHSHHRHSRVEQLHSTRRRREIAQNGGDSGPSLLEEGDSSQLPTLPAADTPPEEACDSSHNLACLEHRMNGPDTPVEKRDDTASSDSVTLVETVLQVVDASSHVLLQSTAADYPVTISDSAFGAFTISSADSITATASLDVTASVDVALMTSPTLAPATQPTTSVLSETSLLTGSTNSTQSATSTVSQTSSSTIRAASAMRSPARSSTPLISPSSATHTASASVTSPHAYNLWSNPSNSSSSATSPITSLSTSETYITSSSTGFGGSSQTPTATSTTSAPSTSETQASGSNSSSNSDTPKIVGGVVGSVAGLALLIFLLFYFLRRRGFLMGKKGHTAISDDAAAGAGAGALAAGLGTREITERPNNENRFTASYFAPAFMKRWRQSTATMRTDSTVDSTSSERGFQKISGRKLPPVLTHGGDGFGGGLDGDSPTVPGFAPTSPAPGPVGSPTYAAPPPASPYGMPLDSNVTREIQEHIPPSRPGPAHVPIPNTVNAAHSITITPAHPLVQPQSAVPFIPPRPDGLGRSLHSHDGSRSSRFTEGIDM